MRPDNNLNPGFVTIDEAIELIKSDTLENPTVDLDHMLLKQRWIDAKKNFRIPKIRKLSPEEYWKDKYGRTHTVEELGSVYVELKDNYEKELLKKTINDKYYEFKHKEYAELKTRGVSTVADDAEGKTAVSPRARTPMAKDGETLGSGEITTNADGLSV